MEQLMTYSDILGQMVGGLACDSRGESLDENDYVIIHMGEQQSFLYQIKLLKLPNYSSYRPSLCCYDGNTKAKVLIDGSNAYVFKLSNFNMNDFLSRYQLYRQEYFNSYHVLWTVSAVIELQSIHTVQLKLYTASTKDRTYKDFVLKDYVGQNTEYGDFVYFQSGRKKTWHYGIVIGSNKVLTDKLTIERFQHVIKVVNLESWEIEEKKKLISFFNVLSKGKQNVAKTKKIGSLYYSNNRYYLYLGDMGIQWVLTSQSKKYHKVFLKEWLVIPSKLPFEDLISLLNNDTDTLYEVLQCALLSSMIVEKDYVHSYTQGCYVPSQDIIGFKGFVDSTNANMVFLGNVDLSKSEYHISLAKKNKYVSKDMYECYCLLTLMPIKD